MKHLAIVIGLLVASAFGSDEPTFFRIQSTQTTKIISLAQADVITWSNHTVPAPCQIYWTPSLHGLWITNYFLPIVATSTLESAVVPSAFTTGDPSHVLYRLVNQRIHYGQDTAVDLNADGDVDIRFRRNCIGAPEGPYYETIDVVPEAVQAILRPFTNGESILPEGDAWTSTHYPYTIASRPCGATGPFTDQEWANVTNGFLPVRTTESGKEHYGWVHLVFYDEIVFGTTDIYSTVAEVIDSGLNAKEGAGIGAGDQ